MLKRRICFLLFLMASGPLLQSCKDNSGDRSSGIFSQPLSLPVFTNVMNEAGIRVTAVLGQSAAWADFNNDGLFDLIVTNTEFRSPGARNVFLLKNEGDGTFSDVTEGSGILNQGMRSVAWADFNNNGLLDLVVGTSMGNAPPVLYKNLDGTKFADISDEAGVNKEGGVFHAIWVDYNNDGLLDIFQATSKVSILYRNEGNETFVDVSRESGLGDPFMTRSAVWFDFDNDGFQDLFLANHGSNTFYRNEGDGTFTDITDSAGLGGDPSWRSVAVCVGDYNGDGFFDLYVGNIGSSRNALYRNNGNGTFTDVTMETGTQDLGDARTCSWVDVDGDGNIDLFTTNHLNPTKLFRNLGNGRFAEVAPQVGLDSPIDIFAATWGDYNNDGFMDVFLNGHLGRALMKSGGNNANYLILKLIGTGSDTNTSAIGTRVEVHTTNAIQIREVSGGRGCCEQDMLPLYFGLGRENRVDILVRWTNGQQCSFKDVEVGIGRRLKVFQSGCNLKEMDA